MGSEQRNALIAVVLSGLILFGWQYYFAPPVNKAEIVPIGPQTRVESGSTTPATVAATSGGPIEPATIESFTTASGKFEILFNNTLSIEGFKNPQASLPFTDIVGSKTPMKVEFNFLNKGFRTISFVKTAEPNKFYNTEFDITLVTGLNENGVASFDLFSSQDFQYRFIYTAQDLKLENQQQRKFAVYTDELNLYEVGDEESGDRAIKWSGIDFNYHLFSVYFEKPAGLIYRTSASNDLVMYSTKAEKTLSYRAVFVKKEYNYLTSLGHNLKNAVDFGIWGIFAVWILKGLQFFYKFAPNYGLSIILLTLLIRTITFPLQYKSFKSMKKLQLVQPELTKIREKFKDDPQRLQKESMELFKKSGANPIGGCLPLLLQMPVFFAFYKVLYGAVELVDAPFMLWIQDLSNKDPYYVLPVLMTIAMFLQQKLTPNTISDPVQKKVMMFMPLIFGFIMKDLPSGLSLYIFVSTLFGIVQQLMVFNSKDDSSKPVVV